MLTFPAAIRVYLCTVPCDMRRSFDGLSMMAEHIVRCNPFAGHLLVFCNRRTDRLKILYWDRDGWAIWYKRLEAGTFQFPFHPLSGRSLVCVGKRYNRYGKRLLLEVDDETVCSVPPQSTDLFVPDPEVVIGEKHAFFRVADLVELARLIARLRRRDSMEALDGL